jgi:hypothetical protein
MEVEAGQAASNRSHTAGKGLLSEAEVEEMEEYLEQLR